MPDRLAELRRQRALMQEHLAWLEKEIASLSPTAGPALAPAPRSDATPSAGGPTPTPGPAAALTTPRAVPAASAPAAPVLAAKVDVESILDQYRAPAGSLQSDVRKGCLLYFTAALALLAVGVIGLYFLIRKH